MSDKTECPGCGSYSSTIRRAFDDGEPCPSCGLSADAAAEVSAARKRGADADLTQRYTEAIKRADQAETRVRELEGALAVLRRTLEKALDLTKNPGNADIGP